MKGYRAEFARGDRSRRYRPQATAGQKKGGTLTQSVPPFMRSILSSGPQGELRPTEQQPFFV